MVLSDKVFSCIQGTSLEVVDLRRSASAYGGSGRSGVRSIPRGRRAAGERARARGRLWWRGRRALWSSEYPTGTTSSVRKVEVARPPMTVMARLAEIRPLPPPARPKARGKRAKMAANGVTRIGPKGDRTARNKV